MTFSTDLKQHMAKGKEAEKKEVSVEVKTVAKPGEHTEASHKIYFTKEYGRFKIMSGNRQLNSGKIRRIRADIDRGLNVLKYCPVIVHDVNGRLEILDGQHRFYVAKEMQSPVYYVIVSKNLSLHDIAKINSNTEKWKSADYINCYATQDNQHYLTLQEFMDDHGFPLSVSLQMLINGFSVADNGGKLKTKFEQGLFEVEKEQEAKEFAAIVKQFKPFAHHTSRSFVVAISKIINAGIIKIEDLVGKYEKNQDMLTTQGSWKEYCTCLENIYNKGNHTRKVIF